MRKYSIVITAVVFILLAFTLFQNFGEVQSTLAIKRITQDGRSLPFSEAWIDGSLDWERYPENPARFQNLNGGRYVASVTAVPGYQVRARVCRLLLASVDTECSVDSEAPVICTEFGCSVPLDIAAGYQVRLTFKYIKQEEYFANIPKRPNIIVILTDDQRWDTTEMSIYGRSVMPNLVDQMIKPGVIFTNSFVGSPGCCPSRASFLSGGFYPYNTGVLSNSGLNGSLGGFQNFQEDISMPLALQQSGYRTGIFGKYLNEYPGDRRTGVTPSTPFGTGSYVPPGWDNWFVAIDFGAYWEKNYYVNENGTHRFYGDSEADYGTDVTAAKALDFIKKSISNPDGKPVFALVSFHKPHTPANPPSRHASLYGNFVVPRPPSYREAQLDDKPKIIKSTAAVYACDPSVQRPRPIPGACLSEDERTHDCLTEEERDAEHLCQIRTLRAIDDSVGSIVKAVQESGKLNNTVFIYMSDNGYMWGEHGMEGKFQPYEESIRVPLVIRAPGVMPRRDNRMVLANIDSAATILDLAEIPRKSDGGTLIPILNAPTASFRSYIYSESRSEWSLIRTNRWKYVERNTNEKEFYDLTNDRFELNSIHEQPSQEMSGLAKVLDKDRGIFILEGKPHGIKGQSFFYKAEAIGGSKSYTWTISAGALPPGTNLDSSSGIISGTPTQAGIFNANLVATDTSIARYTKKRRANNNNFRIKIEENGSASGPTTFLLSEVYNLDITRCSINGYALDFINQNKTIGYEIYLNSPYPTGVLIGSGVASASLIEEGAPEYSVGHSFSFQVPQQFKDGIARTFYLYAKTDQNRTQSQDSPATFKCRRN